MKTCETCQGTGQVPEPLQVGDIVEIRQPRNDDQTGLAVVLDARNPQSIETLRLTSYRKGRKTWFIHDSIRVVHGHIHIDR